MTARTRAYLQGIFANNLTPTATGFADLFDSFLSLNDSSTQILLGSLELNGQMTVSATARFNGVAKFQGTINFESEVITSATASFQGAFKRSVDSGVSARGSTLSTAYFPTGRIVVATGGTAAQGIAVSPAVTGDTWTIVNRSTSNILAYAATNATIDAESQITVSASTAVQVVYASADAGFSFRGLNV